MQTICFVYTSRLYEFTIVMWSKLFDYMVLGLSLPTPFGGSAFANILKSEVLEVESNYIDWKQRLDVLLGFYGYKEIILVDQPPV